MNNAVIAYRAIATAITSNHGPAHGHDELNTPLLSGAEVAVIILVAALIGVVTALLRQRKTSSERLAEGEQRVSESQSETTELKANLKDAQARFQEEQTRAQKLNHDLAAQRKKTFATQEELKSLRATSKDSAQAAREAGNQPAFTPRSEPKPEDGGENTQTSAKTTAELNAIKSAMDNLKVELAAQAESGEKLRAELDDVRQEVRVAKSQKAEAERLTEKYRRVDIITRNEMALLGDKLKLMGQRYYDAVSELAALRGEIPSITSPEVEHETTAPDDHHLDDFNSDDDSDAESIEDLPPQNADVTLDQQESAQPATAPQ